ncbi:MAG: hypothetical protein IKC79_03670 [Clostridia bacterium]|nr:hypothetical protein [Clostridia bacterium]
MFLRDWIDRLKLDYTGIMNGVRILNINNVALIIDAKLSISTYTTTQIILRHKKQAIFVYGQNLRITDFDNTQTIIRGNITCVSSSEVVLC